MKPIIRISLLRAISNLGAIVLRIGTSVRRTYAIARKELLHIARNKVTLFLTVMSPAFMMLVLMYSFTVDIKEVPVSVLDNDRSPLSQRYVSGLLSTGDVTMRRWALDYTDLERQLERGQIKAGIVIPSGFMDNVVAGREAGVQVLIDGTAPSAANHATAHVVGFTQNMAAEILRRDMTQIGYGDLSFQPVDLRIRTWYNPTLRAIVGYAPALLAVVMGMPGTMAAMTLAREKEHGTLEQLVATPIGRAELLVGKLVPYLLSGLVSVLLCTALIVYWFRVPFRGNIFIFLLLSTDFLLATLSIGLLMSVFIKTQQAAQLLAPLVFTIPAFFLSGIFIPLSSMNPLVRSITYVLPSTHYVAIARQLFLKGWGLAQLWP
ncbi:MAG: ABC transporter permease, partial [Chloroflexi bacterium]|nr:ABC transporter permease [Chloroflexota bacterium]